MGRPLRLLNLTLGVVAVLIAAGLAKTWVAPSVPVLSSFPAPKSSPEAGPLAFVSTPRPPLAQFEVLLEKNPFKQPPPLPPQRGVPPKPAPPPPPLPTLVGTILVDDERRAVLSDKGKAEIYSIGQEAAGGTLTAITEDRVLFKRGDATSELTLRAPIQSGQAAPPPSPSPAEGPPPAPSIVPPLQPPQAIEGSPSLPAWPSSGSERRRLRLLQREGLSGQPQEQGQ
jgi:hypothetical protein